MNYYFVSSKAHTCVKSYLSCVGKVIEVKEHSGVDNPIATHPDLQIINLKGHLVVEPQIDPSLIDFFNTKGLLYELGTWKIQHSYLEHIQYNAVVLDKYLIHFQKYSDPKVAEFAERLGLITIPTRQGYTKCSTVVVDGSSIITSDKGISKAVEKYEVECMLVSEGFVELAPYDYGFLGGASGRVGDALVWNGSLEKHPEAEQIRRFVERKGIQNVEFEGLPLVDIGSILEWKVSE